MLGWAVASSLQRMSRVPSDIMTNEHQRSERKHWSRVLPTARRSRLGPLSEQSRDPVLERCFEDLASCHVLTAEQEQQQTRRLAELELERWSLLLSAPPVAEQMLKRLRRADNPAWTYRSQAELARMLYETDEDRQLVADAQRDLEAIASSSSSTDGADIHKILDRCQKLARSIIETKHVLVRANLRLVVSIARRFPRGTLSLADLIQEGSLGLLKAVDRFDHRRGLRFCTYAAWWIRAFVMRSLLEKARTVRISAQVLNDRRLIERSTTAFAARTGRDPTDVELEYETGIGGRRLADARADGPKPVTISTPEAPEGEGVRRENDLDLLADDRACSPFEAAVVGERVGQLHDVLEGLTPRERDIIQQRFGLDGTGECSTLRALGQRYSISRERIRQIQNQALDKLREQLEPDVA